MPHEMGCVFVWILVLKRSDRLKSHQNGRVKWRHQGRLPLFLCGWSTQRQQGLVVCWWYQCWIKMNYHMSNCGRKSHHFGCLTVTDTDNWLTSENDITAPDTDWLRGLQQSAAQKQHMTAWRMNSKIANEISRTVVGTKVYGRTSQPHLKVL